ncbi:MAG: spondin domain-containing protein, partial [Candidatus Poribacteria bacterium]|nr:spondin domain-containing protein [Candidatus Poribacteria bacterium]
AGVWEGLTGDQLDYLFKGWLYLNVHTDANPPGEIRGQVHMGENGMAVLSGDAEVPSVDADGAGTGVFKLIEEGTALWYSITVTDLSDLITGAHFHGPADETETAGVIFPIITEDFDEGHIEGLWEGLTEQDLEYLLNGWVYVNFHTKVNPSGEIRGQVVGLELVDDKFEVPEVLLFEVTLTNLTDSQVFSPPIMVTHGQGFQIGELGTPASEELRILAETGDNQPLAELAEESVYTLDLVALDTPLPPGESVTEVIGAGLDYLYLSLATMLVQTNDGIVAVDTLPLFDEDGYPHEIEVELFAYDAGTEENNELATHIPGPPFMGTERAETDGVIEPHPGIRGDADVGPEFGWAEPVAHLTIRPLFEADEEKIFVMDLDPGLNMISLPLMPPEPYTARTLAEEIGATTVIKLDSAAQKFVAFTEDQDDDGFPLDGGQGYIVNVPEGGTVTFVGRAWMNVPAAPPAYVRTTAWAFVVSGVLQNGKDSGVYTVVAKNRRTGTVATDLVSVDRGRFAAVWADLNRKSVIEAGDQLEISILDESGNIVSGPFHRDIDIADIRKAYLSLPLIVGDVRPTQTLLAQNFPNPFNPETWMPYQLADLAEVTIRIYDLSGRAVRTLDLGLKPAGFYSTRSTAAYWDGRNSSGERVASGVYFYSLQTQDFSATRKMLIAK